MFEILKVRKYQDHYSLTIPKSMIKNLNGCDTYQILMKDGCLVYKPIDLEAIAGSS